ncbi:hypothetical protein KAW65_06225 [candidate division WOR-3 bacterium]|nr:hypothetical protein [candidate division WOR-3 bacterium]
MIILLFLLLSETTLVRPPFGHSLGYHQVTPFEVKLIFGKSLSFQEPHGISGCKLKALDKLGSDDDDELILCCANSWANQIIYNKSLSKIGVYGKFGFSRGEFWWPHGVVVSPEGNIYVADLGNNRIVKLKVVSDSNAIDSLLWVCSIGSFGCDKLEFDEPFGVALDSKGNLYVTDRKNDRIQIISQDTVFIQEISGLNKPTGIAVIDNSDRWSYYKDNFIVVIDNDGKRIQKFTLNGKLLKRYEKEDANFTSCAIDYYENIWVTDKLKGCIHKFDRNLKSIVRFGKFKSPRGITIWRRFGQVFIVEREVIDYYWIGVDGYVESCYPPIFKPEKEGTTITLYLTEPAHIIGKIYDSSNKLIRDFIPPYKEEPFENYIIWDGRDNDGNVVKSGEYKIKLEIEPTYSSRSYFKKKLETRVICE